MITYVLDSSALIRFIDSEAGSERVEQILVDGIAGRVALAMSAVQWGEVAGNTRKRAGEARERQILSSSTLSEIEVVAATADRATRAADLKVDRKISYADAFALELVLRSSDHILITADYGFKTVEDLARIEFLPAK